MKTKLLFAVGALLLAATISAFVCVNNERKSDSLFSANVEALANGENGSGELCYNSITYKESVQTLYCGTCQYIVGKPSAFSTKGRCY